MEGASQEVEALKLDLQGCTVSKESEVHQMLIKEELLAQQSEADIIKDE